MTADDIRAALLPRPLAVPGTDWHVRAMTTADRGRLCTWQQRERPDEHALVEAVVRRSVCHADGRPAYTSTDPPDGLPHPLWVGEAVGEAVLAVNGFSRDSPQAAAVVPREPDAARDLIRVEILPELPTVAQSAVRCYLRRLTEADRLAFGAWRGRADRTRGECCTWVAVRSMTDRDGRRLFRDVADVADRNGLAFELAAFAAFKLNGI